LFLATASADFRRLLDAGLVVQRGRGRNTGYIADERLCGELREASRGSEAGADS
jgi:hypothetical protein